MPPPAIGTLVFRALRLPGGHDKTLPHQFSADPAAVPAAQVPAAAGAAAAAPHRLRIPSYHLTHW